MLRLRRGAAGFGPADGSTAPPPSWPEQRVSIAPLVALRGRRYGRFLGGSVAADWTAARSLPHTPSAPGWVQALHSAALRDVGAEGTLWAASRQRDFLGRHPMGLDAFVVQWLERRAFVPRLCVQHVAKVAPPSTLANEPAYERLMSGDIPDLAGFRGRVRALASRAADRGRGMLAVEN